MGQELNDMNKKSSELSERYNSLSLRLQKTVTDHANIDWQQFHALCSAMDHATIDWQQFHALCSAMENANIDLQQFHGLCGCYDAKESAWNDTLLSLKRTKKRARRNINFVKRVLKKRN